MSRRTLTQISFFDPQFVCPAALQVGTVAWVLAHHRSMVLPGWLFVGWRGEGRLGRAAWPAPVLATLLLLRWVREGMSRRGACAHAVVSAEWRAALGLQMDSPTPDEKTVREFERFLRGRHPEHGVRRYELLHDHIVRLCQQAGVVGDRPLWVTDSTPMLCYGAVLDTVRLLGDGLRMLGRTWARLTRSSLSVVAQQWELPLLLARSTKGTWHIDWSDRQKKTAVITELAEAVVRVTEQVRRAMGSIRPNKRKGVLRQCRALLRVVADDLQADDEGNVTVAERVTRGRLVSITDLQARSGRKSKSQPFKGFKVHVLGDAVSGLIASLAVTEGNVHDGVPAPRVLLRAKTLITDLARVLADTAYGGASLRRSTAETLGIRLVSPPPPYHGRPSDKLSKNEFTVDFEAETATCPNGQTTATVKSVLHGGYVQRCQRYTWAADQCAGCPLAKRCPTHGRKGTHSILLHPDEQLLRQTRDDWKDEELRQEYRQRSRGERLVYTVTRHGGRKARQWGLGAARQQAYAIAAAANLLLLAKALAQEEQRQRAAA